MDGYREQLSQDMAEARHRIMRLFGGMGSISDVVLYREGHLLTTETTNFINCCRHSTTHLRHRHCTQLCDGLHSPPHCVAIIDVLSISQV
ncbi:hypothetical protein [Pseudomonas sp. LS-2]|uniref:DUF6966 domain-containing protein n=1 Tax=Pseudomonas sp. LS-2 TaxID=2315859 RepID=UPI0035C8531D